MSLKMRALLAGACLSLLAATGGANAQITSGMKQAREPVPAINVGKLPRGMSNANPLILKSVASEPGGAITFTRGQPAIAYPASDLAGSNSNAALHGAVRVIMPPVSVEESRQALSSRVFPANLNQGAVMDKGVASKAVLKASGITGDTHAAGPASIPELARSLRYNPDLIYQYVRNNIEFYPAFGVQKGALGAVLDNQGTAYDQSMLMVELLHASGIEANYVIGVVKLSAPELASWYGIDTSNACAVLNLLGQGQIPVYRFQAATVEDCPGPTTALVNLSIEHVWVRAKINNAWYVFDPSRKPHTVKAGIELANNATTRYNSASFISDANLSSTSGPDWVQNINRANIRKNLDQYAGNLADYLRNNKPTATLDDVIGGKAIVPFYDALRQSTLPYQDMSVSSIETPTVPNSLKPTLRIQYQGIDQTYTSDAIYGRRLTITYNAANQPVLKLDGTAVGSPGTPAATGAATKITFTVIHNAYVLPFANESFAQTIRAGGTNTYAIANAWGPSGRGPAENYRAVINDQRASSGATSDMAEPLLGSTLAMIGAQWIAQNDQSAQVTGQIGKVVLMAHHRFGIIGYVNNAYVDLPGNRYGTTSMTGDINAENAAFASTAMHSSILESTAVEQTTGISAVSTIKLIDIASAAGQKIYSALPARFATFVQPNLVNCSSQIPAMNAALAAGSRVITPARCDITENNWSGAGYLTTGPGLQFEMLISDGLAGGFSTMNQLAAKLTAQVGNNQAEPSKLAGTVFTSADPIDMVRGNFVYDHDDLDTGIGAFPQSLTFKRFYSSGNRTSNGILGKGWTHNFAITAATGSDGFQAMGERSALDAVGTVVEQKVSLDLLLDSTRPLNKLVMATLAQRWFGDQLINNTVIVTQGAGGEVFVKLPDGTYNPPPGKSAKLTKNADGTFAYESLHRDVLKFNAAGKAESYTDSSGVQAKYSYAGDNLTGIKNSLGRSLGLTYANGKLSRVTNGAASVSYSYDTNENLSAFADPLGKSTTYTYSIPGRMDSIFYPSFPTIAAVTNTYDSLNRVRTQTNARGKTYEYFFAGSRTEEIAPDGGARTNYIDGQGNVLLLSTPIGNLTVNTYDGQSRLIRTERPEGNATEYTYDDESCAGAEKRCSHNVATERKVGMIGSSAAPITQSFTYESAFNRLASARDPKGNVTQYTYTAQGLPLAVTTPTDSANVAPVSTYGYTRYDPRGYPSFYLPTSVTVKTSAANDVVSTTSYITGDNYEPEIRTVDAGTGRLKLETAYYYDEIGNVTMVSQPGSVTSTVDYDAARRVIQTKDDAGIATNTTYDADGRPVTTATRLSVTGTDWMTTCHRYSATGKVIRTWGPALTTSATACPVEAAPVAIIDTEYDDLDRPFRVTQYLTAAEGGKRVTETAYNADDTVQAVKRAVGTSVAQTYAAYEYTPNGNIDTLADAKGNLTVYDYDAFDRRIRTYYPTPAQPGMANGNDYEETTYDANGNVTAMRRRSGQSIKQSWDKLNRMVSRTYPLPADNIQYTYDLRGLRTQARYMSGMHSNTYVWDNAGRLSSSTSDNRTLTYRYDISSNRSRLTWPDGFYVDTPYDSRHRLLQILENGGAVLEDYRYDNLGRRTSVTGKNGSLTQFQYDAQNGLIGMSHTLNPPETGVQYAYTRNQAAELKATSWSNDAYQWTGANPGARVFTVDGLNRYQSYGYDANGNLTSDGTSSYTYDVDNRLRTASRGAATLSYDPEGRLQRTVVNGTTTDLLYDGSNLIAEYDAAGVLKKRYVHGAGTDEPVVSYDGAGTTAKTWLFADQLGSVVATADENGIRTGVFSYGPHGETGTAAGPRFRFTGQQYIDGLELYYYKARFYSPRLGRFLQTDPVGTKDDLNLYAYVGNNPVNRVDPTGLAKVELGVTIQIAGVVTDPSHYIKRVGAGNIDSVVNAAVGIAQSPGFVGGTSFGMTVNGVNYNVRSFVLPMGDINLGTIHPDDGRHR